MTTLIIGLVLFLGIHLLPTCGGLRRRIVTRIGENPYKGLFSLVSLAGLLLIVVGMGRRPLMVLWQPPVWSRYLAVAAMVPAFILLAAAYIPGNVKRFTRHPMLWGVTIWALAHLQANGDLGSVVLFGSFVVYALFDMWSANRRGEKKSTEKRPGHYDIAVIVVGVCAYLLFFFFHSYIIGVPILMAS